MSSSSLSNCTSNFKSSNQCSKVEPVRTTNTTHAPESKAHNEGQQVDRGSETSIAIMQQDGPHLTGLLQATECFNGNFDGERVHVEA